GGTANRGVDLAPSSKTIPLQLTSTNDPHAALVRSVTILEDGSHAFSAADFGFSDPNDSPADAFSAVKITSLPGAGTLKLSGVAVTLNQVIPVASLGSLVYAPAANANGAAYAADRKSTRLNSSHVESAYAV